MSLFLVGARPHHAADRHPAVSRVEDRSDHRRGIGGADLADRRRHADHRPLRQAGAGRLTWRASTSTSLTKRYGDFYAVRDVSLTSPTASSWCCWDRRAAARPRPCAWSRASSSRPAGTVRLGGADVTLLPPWKRNAGMVFQSYALFPHLTRGAERRLRPRDAQAAARRHRAPRRGGAGAWCGSRAMAAACRASSRAASSSAWRWPARSPSGPTCCCSTSRSSNLDAKLRQEVRVEIRELQRQLGLTTVMVTHDQEEALTMADRLVVMNEGRCARSAASATSTKGRPTASSRASSAAAPSSPARSRRPAASAATAACRSPAAAASPGAPSLSLRPERLEIGPRAAAGTRQQPARYGGIRVLSRRPDRHPCAPVAQRPAGGADRQSRGRFRAGGRPARPCRLAGIGRPGLQRVIDNEDRRRSPCPRAS